MFTGVLHGPDELVGRTLHELVHDVGCIFVPFQFFKVSRCLDTILGHNWIYAPYGVHNGGLEREYLAYVKVNDIEKQDLLTNFFTS